MYLAKGNKIRGEKKGGGEDLLLTAYQNSGAGKTVSAKFIMRYFATADDQEGSAKKKKKSDGAMTEVEEQILGKII